MIIDSSLKKDPFISDSVVGWGVIRFSPWDLFGVFSSYEQAQEFASILGEDYEVIWGTYRLGTSEFLCGFE
ncbi:hypothetical protein ACXDTG_004881 [Klebsiella pneumoniae]